MWESSTILAPETEGIHFPRYKNIECSGGQEWDLSAYHAVLRPCQHKIHCGQMKGIYGQLGNIQDGKIKAEEVDIGTLSVLPSGNSCAREMSWEQPCSHSWKAFCTLDLRDPFKGAKWSFHFYHTENVSHHISWQDTNKTFFTHDRMKKWPLRSPTYWMWWLEWEGPPYVPIFEGMVPSQ